MNEDFLRRLMEADVPKRRRRKARYPMRLTPPRCDTCGKQLAPGVDHSACRDAA